MALICGMPTPLTTRVVQMEPGPIPTLIRSSAGFDQIMRGFFGRDISGDELSSGKRFLTSLTASRTRVE